ncbi:hypothetical protein DL766_007676 [Monosporascus sp. MC13-8B]|uniref:MARVEL domain-containing protein n=1 Tax=Monosporascus cannonballus TaxID=155416 RepID=A0ABY0H3P3_9PEZI|nr:hypothetical protein DL762_006012 [Monosporascus cannonballus]RYO89171.1 hypothetical protein DL763_005763 [Monosporascus cannonballus]RYP22622.1 hypothetical protein DL766_007676 [Monosporascus sp. MC13-8B]
MLGIGAVVVRVLLFIFGAVVLGLSIGLAKHQVVESVPPVTSFSGFVGAFGLIVTALGLLSLRFEKIPIKVVIAADALSAVFYIAAGIALSLALKSVSSCSADDPLSFTQRFENRVLNGGCEEIDGRPWCYSGDGDSGEDFTPGRCKRARADNVFEYFGFILAIAVIVITYLAHRRGGTTSTRGLTVTARDRRRYLIFSLNQIRTEDLHAEFAGG